MCTLEVLHRKYCTLAHQCYLPVVVFDDLQVKEVILVLAAQRSVPASCLGRLQCLLGAEVIRWRGRETDRERKG